MAGGRIKHGSTLCAHAVVKNNAHVLLNWHNNKKLLGHVKASDRHCNMVVENVKEMWTNVPKNGKGKKKYKPVNKDRYISKMFLTGDIMALQNYHCRQGGSPQNENTRHKWLSCMRKEGSSGKSQEILVALDAELDLRKTVKRKKFGLHMLKHRFYGLVTQKAAGFWPCLDSS
ncbi:hypothetical protein GH733_014743 [Mirounga leonina]|nr:hypothetical protein GH733_014743 [Mirounga leonina]